MQRIYGLIGLTLKHSWSKQYFTGKFSGGNINAVYNLYELQQIDEIIKLVEAEKRLCGLNVTIPYKQSVIPFLSAVSPEAAAIGAVNAIAIDRSSDEIRMTGYNTDAPAFAEELIGFAGKPSGNALILGTGGAAKAVDYVLEKQGWSRQFVSRKPAGQGTISYTDLDADILKKTRLIVNATPLGMYPAIDTAPPLPWELIGSAHFLFDLVYNPEVTRFMKEGERRGARVINGLGMLKRQADLAWEIWHTKNTLSG